MIIEELAPHNRPWANGFRQMQTAMVRRVLGEENPAEFCLELRPETRRYSGLEGSTLKP
jgi:hypothetical protein